MNRKPLRSFIALAAILLAAFPAPMIAQSTDTPEVTAPDSPTMEVFDVPMTLPSDLHLRAEPGRADFEPVSAQQTTPQAGAWELGPATPFQFTRFDAVFVPGPEGEPWANKVYFPGGRDGTTESPNIWMFDPVLGTYTDTGDDMVEDVSNYTVNLILDDGTGNGPAIYIVGGYDADNAAGNIDRVQRYYPQTGVAEMLPTADNWRVLVAGNQVGAQGSAVVNDIIYVFGGWENAAAPYFYAGTWAFDPRQPSGSRWTQLTGAPLSQARAYPQVAVQDGKIYAMGGIYNFDTSGPELTPTDLVEVLDTRNLGAGWTTRSSMPVAGAEGRAFGFDSDTHILGYPNPLPGHIFVVGVADWPDGSQEALEYLTGPDSWDQNFPDLNEDRRDHAGVYIPLCTPDPDDGLPGLWVFGGHWDNGDAPPFAPTEYYPLACLECDILLVDDDWDFDESSAGPNDGGRPYYTSTLDHLGYNYTVWDTVTQGQPGAADMAGNEVVIWFTGYAWEGVISPTDEIEIGDYLVAGGNLILSAQEYYYDAGGVNTFMEDYLGIASFPNQDVVVTQTTGVAGALGEGLGPYVMARPDDWAAYWPTDNYEGPYDDEVSAATGADEPFRYNAPSNTNFNATSYEGSTFKSLYLAWPFEWIPDPQDRADILGEALAWMCAPSAEPEVRLLPPYQEDFGGAGESVDFDISLTNLLGVADTFQVAITGNTWTTGGPSSVGPVANGDTVNFQVTVDIPPDADCLDEDMATVVVWDSTMTYSDTATLRTIAGPNWEVENNSGAVGAHWVASTCTDDYGAAGACFYVGGLTGAGVTGHGQLYDIATDTWTPLAAPAPTPVFAATLGYIDGKLYLAGGFTSDTGDWGGAYALQIYDLGTGTWSAGPAIPPQGPITGAGGSNGAVINGKLHVTAGCGANNCSSNQHVMFDPVSSTWLTLAPVPDTLTFHGAASGNGKLYVGGDYFGDSGFYEYDVATNSWLSKVNLPTNAGKKSPVAAVTPGGGVFWWGGDLGNWTGVQNSTWYWDPVANGWVEFTAVMHQETTGAGGGLADGKLWNFAGSTGAGALTPPPHESLAYCIPPSAGAGALAGCVYDANTGDPLENALVWVDGLSNPDYYDERYSLADGCYAFDPIIAGDYEVSVAAYEFYNEMAVAATVVTDTITTQDFHLAASDPDMPADPIEVAIAPDSVHTVTLTLGNDGAGNLEYYISEIPEGNPFPVAAQRDLTTMPSGVLAEVDAAFEASVDGTSDFIVYLSEQADLSRAFAIRDRSLRGQYVLNALQRVAERSQTALRADLDRKGVAYTPHYIVNALTVRGDRALANALAARSEVAFIGANIEIEAPAPASQAVADAVIAAVEWNIQQVEADDVWTDFGATGAGVVIANIDTGVQWDHPTLVNQYRGGAGNHDYNWWDPYGDRPNVPEDPHGHGTHTMGTMLGDDGGTNQIGMAPGATWFACNGFKNGGSGYNNELLECAEFILAPWDLTGQNPDPDLRADIVNNSWGGGQAQWWYNQAIYAWQAAGMLPVFSIGNEGPLCGTAGDPGDMQNILAVGATDDSDSNAPGSPADFSSRGPAAVTGLIKPNVSAPGANIRSALPGNTYGAWGGTSMAAPHVAGEAALIWSAQPELWGDVGMTYWLITQHTQPLVVDQGYFCGLDTASNVPNNQYGWGRINAHDAVDAALQQSWDLPWLDVAPAHGMVLPAGSESIALTFDATGMTDGECYTGTLLAQFNDPYIGEMDIPVKLCAEACAPVSGVDLMLQTAGTLHPNTLVDFLADISPDGFTAPYTYTIDYGCGASAPQTSSDDPLALQHTFTIANTYTVEIAVWNCTMTVPVTDSVTVTVEDYRIFMPLMLKNN
ncbi:MAG: S8 family serine peptidase [Anaerolineae bacterium]|nr:S8 family serine peptidase [Anaerolineae bacterium]